MGEQTKLRQLPMNAVHLPVGNENDLEKHCRPHCTVNVVRLEVEATGINPVAVMVTSYVAAGVPLLLFPPQASWQIKPGESAQASSAILSFLFFPFGFEPRPTPVPTNPIIGSQSA